MGDSCTFVIFGATGNLSRNKLLPALYHLQQSGKLPDGMTIVGMGRKEFSREQWQAHVRELLQSRARGSLNEEVFAQLAERLKQVEAPRRHHRRGVPQKGRTEQRGIERHNADDVVGDEGPQAQKVGPPQLAELERDQMSIEKYQRISNIRLWQQQRCILQHEQQDR